MGTILIFAGALFIGLATGYQQITWGVLVLLFILYLLGELLEYALVMIGARSFGSTGRGAFGALVGGILGFMLGATIGLGIGIIPFTLLGIFLGGFLMELDQRKTVKQAIKSGAGGVFGRLGVVVMKVLLTIVMIWIVVSRLIAA